jgi:cytochrome P450
VTDYLLETRAMLHDETVYPEPFEFKPERFMKDGQLNPAVRDPDHAVFGFGRRWARPSSYYDFEHILRLTFQYMPWTLYDIRIRLDCRCVAYRSV